VVKRWIPLVYGEDLYRALRAASSKNMVRMPKVRLVMSQHIRGCDGVKTMRLLAEMVEMGLVNKVEKGFIVLNEVVD